MFIIFKRSYEIEEAAVPQSKNLYDWEKAGEVVSLKYGVVLPHFHLAKMPKLIIWIFLLHTALSTREKRPQQFPELQMN